MEKALFAMAETKPRIDKWLWATRWCKTRQDAVELCRGGWVVRGETPLKPAAVVRVGEVIRVRHRNLWRTLVVLDVVQKRVGAALAQGCYRDETPAAAIEEWQEKQKNSALERARGTGRPTKKERRDWQKFF